VNPDSDPAYRAGHSTRGKSSGHIARSARSAQRAKINGSEIVERKVLAGGVQQRERAGGVDPIHGTGAIARADGARPALPATQPG